MTPVEVCRMMYGANPFPESYPIAEYLKEHTSAGDRIAVIGSEPQIFSSPTAARPPDMSMSIV